MGGWIRTLRGDIVRVHSVRRERTNERKVHNLLWCGGCKSERNYVGSPNEWCFHIQALLFLMTRPGRGRRVYRSTVRERRLLSIQNPVIGLCWMLEAGSERARETEFRGAAHLDGRAERAVCAAGGVILAGWALGFQAATRRYFESPTN